MNFNEYQKKAATFSLLGKIDSKSLASEPGYVAKILGLVGEAGEVAEKYKKIIRDKAGEINEVDKKELVKELGDVLWYIAVLSEYLDTSLEELAVSNIEKLTDRKARGTQRGKGDNR